MIFTLTMLLHAMQELDNDLRAWSDENLALAGFLSVVDGIERIIEDASLDHDCGSMRFSTQNRELRYLHWKMIGVSP